MNTKELKKEIEKTAKKAGISNIDIITVMQSECAKKGDERPLSILCKIKNDYI